MKAMGGRSGIALRLLLVLAIQAGALGWMIAGRAQILRNGQEATLSVRPVDPRDLFRGDYVVLAYDISTLRPALLSGENEGFERNGPVFVELSRAPEGPARAVAIWHAFPEDTSNLVIEGRIRSTFESHNEEPDADGKTCPTPCPTLRVNYGLEQFFVPEGEGRELEDMRDDSRIEVIAAVDSSGKAAIKRLLVDGKSRYEEPLF